MKKILILIAFLCFISGCTIEYEMLYKSENNINETIEISVDNEIALSYADSIEEYFKDIFNSWKNSYNLKNYEYEIKEYQKTSTIIIQKKNDNLNEIINNSVFDFIFKDRNIYKQNNDIIIEMSDYSYNVITEDMLIDYDKTLSSKIKMKIKSNYIVECNADKKNEVTGTYEWEFTPEDAHKKLEIIFTDKLNLTAYLYNMGTVFWITIFIIITILAITLIYKLFKNKISRSNKI